MDRRAFLGAAVAGVAGVSGCLDATVPAVSGPEGDGDGRQLPELAGPFDRFDDLTAWTAIEGSFEADPSRSVTGDQSVRVTTDGSGDRVTLEREFADPLDITGVIPGAAVASTELTVPWIKLVDRSGSIASYRRGLKGDLPLMRYNFGIDFVDDDFDRTAVTEVKLQVAGREGARTVWFDDLHFVPRPSRGQVMIQFDDCHVTDYTEALPLLSAHDLPAVTFVNPRYCETGLVAGDPRLSPGQLHELAEAGWTVANHTLSHADLSQLDRADQEAEIVDGKEWLRKEGFSTGAKYFAYPFGRYDATTLELIDRHHEIAFSGGFPAQGYTTNTRLASRVPEPGAAEVGDILQRTADWNGITALFYHRLEGSLLEDFEVMVDELASHVAAGSLEVILPADLEDRYLF